jgi:glycosyltransferase involved in cell wall biosynthesis
VKVEAGVLERLGADLVRLRGDATSPPDASIVIPVNAQADLENVLFLLGEVAQYRGRRSFEIVLVINNYHPDDTPEEVGAYAALGLTVVSIPNLKRTGETTAAFAARVPGVRAATSERVLLFDADCRILNPTPLFDWYISELDRGGDVAYTHVGYHELRPRASVKARILIHHWARWVKRVVFRIPTTRGSNYAVRRSMFLGLYEDGLLAEDLNVGPTVKAGGGRVVYSGSRDLVVLTSGRKFKGGWLRLARYLRYRLLYNLRMRPVRPRFARGRRGPEK